MNPLSPLRGSALRSLALSLHWCMTIGLVAGMGTGLALGLGGCAYHAGYGERALPGGYKTVAIPMFKNNTHETGIEVYFTNAMVRELERMRIGRLTDRNEAQTTLLGTVNSVDYIPGNTDVGSNNDPKVPNNAKLNLQYRVVIVVLLRLVRNADQKVLWEGSFDREQTYLTPQIGIPSLTSVSALYNTSARYQTIEAIASDMMAEAHDRITENF